MFLLWFLKNKIIVLSIIHMFCGSFYFVCSHQYFFTKFLHYGYEKIGYKNNDFTFFTIISWNISQKQLHQHVFKLDFENFFLTFFLPCFQLISFLFLFSIVLGLPSKSSNLLNSLDFFQINGLYILTMFLLFEKNSWILIFYKNSEISIFWVPKV